MSNKLKFVTFYNRRTGGENIIVFPNILQHLDFASAVENKSFGSLSAISGGFVEDGECVGKSISLRMKSRGEEDTALLADLLGHS